MNPEYNMVISTKSFNMTDEEFVNFCEEHGDLRIERDSNSNIIIMSPVLDESSALNMIVCAQLFNWNEKNKTGIVFDSSAGFILPNNAMRSPDATWLELNNYKTAKQLQADKKGFLKITPDFVVEVKSESDALQTLISKIDEYIANGVRLAYLINSDNNTVTIYKPGLKPEQKSFSEKIIATDVVAGFELDLSTYENPIK